MIQEVVARRAIIGKTNLFLSGYDVYFLRFIAYLRWNLLYDTIYLAAVIRIPGNLVVEAMVSRVFVVVSAVYAAGASMVFATDLPRTIARICRA